MLRVCSRTHLVPSNEGGLFQGVSVALVPHGPSMLLAVALPTCRGGPDKMSTYMIESMSIRKYGRKKGLTIPLFLERISYHVAAETARGGGTGACNAQQFKETSTPRLNRSVPGVAVPKPTSRQLSQFRSTRAIKPTLQLFVMEAT